jgi:hypothetical protein
MENTTAVEEPSDLELKNILLLRRHRNGKHDIPNRPFMIVQSIDKLPVASGDRVALLGVTCIWFSSDLKLQKAGFPQRTLSKTVND